MQVTEKIAVVKVKKGLTWAQIAKEVGRSPVWTTAALHGQMPMSKEEA
jgi:cyanate lyase